MPIEIRELVIKATIENGDGERPGRNGKDSSRNEIVAACVEQVMEIISKNEER